MLTRYAAIAAAVVLVNAADLSGAVAASTPSKADFSASLLVGSSEVQDPSTVWLGVDVKLGPKWHTYWRSPGDAGAPPEFDWSQSTNVASARVKWPAPHRFSEASLDTFGYADHMLFPIELRLKDGSAPAHVHLNLALYVCATICTSNHLQFDADLTPGLRNAKSEATIDHWRKTVPRSDSVSISIKSISFTAGPPTVLHVNAVGTPALGTPDAFVDGDDAITALPPHVKTLADGVVSLDLPIRGLESKAPSRPLTLTLVDGDRAIEAKVPSNLFTLPQTLSRRTAHQPKAEGTGSLWPMIALSLLGGLVLNFMPCVLPVLSLKLFSLVGHAGHRDGAMRIRLLASAAGVIASFLVLAAALSLLKSAGAQIGWGIQFQQPSFLILMIGVLALMVANLIGMFEMALPWRLGTALDRTASGPSLGGHFFNGFVMTLLATPCSAPFVGSAIIFALSQGAAEIFMIFAGLGVGMASPYLALASAPKVAQIFPRPGSWMQAVRQVAAAAMAATAFWLLIVLADVSDTRTALLVGAPIGLLLWIGAVVRNRFPNAIAGILIAMLASIAVVQAGAPYSQPPARGQINWQPLVPMNVQQLVREGRTVFVDVGAAWCLTCKVNEKLIIDSGPIQAHLKSDVIPVRADWTKPDKTISAYLQSFGRYGLPFNAVFGPAAPDGIVLPELLTEDAVLQGFNTASRRNSSQ